MASKLYIRNVQYRMGGISLGKLQKHFMQATHQSNSDYWSSNSRRFYKNANGSEIKDDVLIRTIEDQLPGSKYILVHPLWSVLSNPFADSTELRDMMVGLPSVFHTTLFKNEGFDGAYIRKPFRTLEPVRKIGMRNSLSALACLLMLLREKEIEQLWHQYVTIKWKVLELLGRLTYFEPVRFVSDELSSQIDNFFVSRHNPLPEEFILSGFEKFYKSPEKVRMNELHTLFSYVLDHLDKTKSENSQKEIQLRFLFIVQEIGISKVIAELIAGKNRTNSALLSKLSMTVNSKHVLRKLPPSFLLSV